MRHLYFRLILGFVWLGAALSTAIKANFSHMALYLLLGAVFLYSAYSLRKKSRKSRKY